MVTTPTAQPPTMPSLTTPPGQTPTLPPLNTPNPGAVMNVFGTSQNTSGSSDTTGGSTSGQVGGVSGATANQVSREWDPFIGQTLGDISGVEGTQTIAPGLSMLSGSAAPVNYSSDVAPLLNPYALSQIQSRFAAERPDIENRASSIEGSFASNPYSDARSNALANYYRGVNTQQGAEAGQILAGSYQQALQAAEQQRAREAAAGQGYIGAGVQTAGLVPGLVQAGNVGTAGAQEQQSQARAAQNYWSQNQYQQQQYNDPSMAGTALGMLGMAAMLLNRGGKVQRPIRARYANAGVVAPGQPPTVALGSPSASLPPWMTPQTPLSTPATSATTGVAPMQPLAVPTAPVPGSAAATPPATGPTGIMTPTPQTPQTAPSFASFPGLNPGLNTTPASTANPAPAPAASASGPGAPIMRPPGAGTAPIAAFGNLQTPSNPVAQSASASPQITPFAGKALTPSGAVAQPPGFGAGYAHGGGVEDHHRFADKVAHAFHAFHAMRKHAQDPGPDHRQHMQDAGVAGDFGGWDAGTSVSVEPQSLGPTGNVGDDVVNKALDASAASGQASDSSTLKKLSDAASKMGQQGKDGSGNKQGGANIPTPQIPAGITATLPTLSDSLAFPRYAADGGAIDARPRFDDGGGVLSGLLSPIKNLFSGSSNTPAADPNAPLAPGGTPPQGTVTALTSYGLPASIPPLQRLGRALTQVEGPRGFNASGFGKEYDTLDQRDIQAAGLLQKYEAERGLMLAPNAQGQAQPTLTAGIAAGRVPGVGGGYTGTIAATKLPYEIQKLQAENVPGQLRTGILPELYKLYNTKLQTLMQQEMYNNLLEPSLRQKPEFFQKARQQLQEEFNAQLQRANQEYANPVAQGKPTPLTPDSAATRYRKVPPGWDSTPGAP